MINLITIATVLNLLKFSNLNLATSSSQVLGEINQASEISQTKLEPGYSYLKTVTPFTFSLSNLSLDFGELTPSRFISRTQTLSVLTQGGGYSVTASQDHPLQLKATTVNIPDTECNSVCSEIQAGSWNSRKQFGFGYRLSGDDVPPEFNSNLAFKQMADRSRGEPAQTIMISPGVNRTRQAQVSYKLNIPNTQPSGDYRNTIVFFAAPTY